MSASEEKANVRTIIAVAARNICEVEAEGRPRMKGKENGFQTSNPGIAAARATKKSPRGLEILEE
jgi:hypothetical protein